MLDIKFVRENSDKVKENLRKRGSNFDIDTLLQVDKRRREVLVAIEDMKAKKNQASKLITSTKEEKERQRIILEMKELDSNNDNLEREVKEVEENFNSLIRQMPNLLQDSVPEGKNDAQNVVLREEGQKPNFDFQAKDHLQIGENLDIIDVKNTSQMSGSRFASLKNEAVLIEFALVRFAFDVALKEGFSLIIPPVLIKEGAMKAMGHIDTKEDLEERYFLEKNNLFLVGTSEQSVGPLYQDEVFEEKDLPKRFISFSSCFREEAGSYGKDTRGILRVHQFDKVELFSFTRPEDSLKEHELLLAIEEKLVAALNLPYRVVKLCAGDLSSVSSLTYDIETWLPSENKYRETHSTSNCLDFQARRLNTRYRSKDGKTYFVHTLNGTAFAIQRMLVMILENYQQKDGSVIIPEALKPYIPGLTSINKK